MEVVSKIKCASCGKQYAMKPQYAGKSVRCHCGNAIKVPAEEAPLPDEPQFTDEEYDIAPTAPPPRTPKLAPASAGVATAVAPAAPVLGYARPAPPKSEIEQEVEKAARISDLYVPLALIVVGVFLALFEARLEGIRNPLVASLYVLITTAVNLVMLFVALMIAMKLLDLGFGPVGTAILKMVPVAIVPAAVSGIIGHYTMGMVPWGVSLLCYWALLSYLFEMDGGEVYITTFIIWIIGMVMLMIVLPIMLTNFGVASKIPRQKARNSTAAKPIEDNSPQGIWKRDYQLAARFANGNGIEARAWYNADPKARGGGNRSRKETVDLIEKFYAAGAKKVWAVDFSTEDQAPVCTEFVVEMPDGADARKAVLDVLNKFDDSDTPKIDRKQLYQDVPMD